MRRSGIVLTLAVLLLAGCAGQDGSGRGDSAAAITADGIREDVERLASDEFEGRGPGTNGDKAARRYLASRLERMGYEPAGIDGGWEQPFFIVGMNARLRGNWIFLSDKGREISFRLGKDFIGAAGVQRDTVSIKRAEIVFVGYGIDAPEQGWDDFKGVDLRGKILLMLNDDPDWEKDLFAGERKLYYGRWRYKYESAARQGAAGAIIIHTTASAGYPWEVVLSSWSGEQFEVPAGDEPHVELQAWLTEKAAARLVSLAGMDLSELIASARSRQFRPVPLGVESSIRFPVDIRRTETANVIGMLRGSDPELASEAVIFTAHHDHFGIGEPDETGDGIYNGALDNGVAMAQALAVAGAFASLSDRPRRSIMILFPAAEEQGLLGSSFYTRNPTVLPGKIAANINFELGNIWGRTRDVTIFGKGKSTLEDLLTDAAARQGRYVTAEKTVRAGWYYRSDQFSFARIGVPAIWFKSGTDFIGRPPGWGEATHAAWIERNYHRPGDEVREEWNYEGLVEDARLAFELGVTVAGADEMPSWFPGDEFEAIRLEALKEASGATAGD